MIRRLAEKAAMAWRTGSFHASLDFVGMTRILGPTSVVVGDFNGDGAPVDQAFVNEYGDSVSVFLGNGDRTFQGERNIRAENYPRSIAAGDFNGDGLPDLAVANDGSNDVSVLLGMGNWRFQAAQNFGTGSGPFFAAVGDFNGDGLIWLWQTNLPTMFRY